MKITYRNILYLFNNKIIKSKTMVAAASGAFLLLGAGAVEAQIAAVSQTVNLRQGPGINYARIAALPRGVSVHIDTCRGGWCQVRSSWGLGWVSGRYLLRGNAGSNYVPGGGAYPRPQTQIYFGLNVGRNYWDYDPYYRPYYPHYWPGYRPHYWPGYRPYHPGYRPYPGRGGGWNPHWGVGPARMPFKSGPQNRCR